MTLAFENLLVEYLKQSLPYAYRGMVVNGHSTQERPLPYISVDCAEKKPFGDLEESDGFWEQTLTIAIADSAHDIRYGEHFQRVRAVRMALRDFHPQSDSFCLHLLDLENESDARDDNKLGTLLTYKALVQVFS